MTRRSFEHLIPLNLDFQCENARIMIIDDEPIMTRFVAECLKKSGFGQIEVVNNPQLALAKIAKFEPDLILLDIKMPGIDGIELLEAIKTDMELNHVSVVMLSAANKQIKYQALNLGAVDFINKPVDADNLKTRVRKALRIV